MTTASAGDAHLIPVYGYMYRETLPILKNDGSLITSGTIDGKISKDAAGDGATSNTPTQIATTSGLYYLDLTATEMQAMTISGSIGSTATGANRTPFTIKPRRFGSIFTGTAQAGAGSTITIASAGHPTDNLSLVGCLIGITGGTGVGQLREIISYVASTQVVTVGSAWGTNPDATSTYEILVPNMQLYNAIQGYGAPTAIPATAVTTNGSLLTSGTGNDQIKVDNAGNVYVNVNKWLTKTIPAATIDGVPLVDINAINGSTAAAIVLALINSGAIVSDHVTSVTSGAAFDGTSGLSAVNGEYNNQWMLFVSGANAGLQRKITTYTNTGNAFAFSGTGSAFDAAWPNTVAINDKFLIIGRAP